MATQGLPISFRSGSGDNRFNYDWFDYAAGAGYKRFYVTGGNDSTGLIYYLSTKSLESDSGNASFSAGISTTEFNFDITFNAPITIAAADAYIRTRLQTTASSSKSIDVAAKIYHVTSGGTETALGNGTCATLSGVSQNSVRVWKFALTKKSFGIGEKIRLELIITIGGGNSASITWDNGTAGNEMFIDIPFVVDL